MEYAKDYYQCDTLGGVFLEDSTRYDYLSVPSTVPSIQYIHLINSYCNYSLLPFLQLLGYKDLVARVNDKAILSVRPFSKE